MFDNTNVTENNSIGNLSGEFVPHVSPFAFDQVFHDGNLTVYEKSVRLGKVVAASRQEFVELYRTAPDSIQVSMMRDMAEAYRCLYEKYAIALKAAELEAAR